MNKGNQKGSEFGNKIGTVVYECFSKLPKNGKCQEHEWTVLSAIVLENQNKEYSVVTMGTGTKCLSSNKLSPTGMFVNDCHSEIVTRRNFILYLLKELEKATNGDSESLFEFDEEKKKYKVKKGISFHLYVSQSPCGEASIFEEENAKAKASALFESRKRNKQRSQERCVLNSETSQSIEESIHLTGAKRLMEIVTDSTSIKTEDIPLRIKPGRGILTTSNCCSDKLALYCVLGIQGKLLSCVMEPVYLDSVIISCHYNETALQRCFQKRLQPIESLYSIHIPKCYPCSIMPSFCQEEVAERLNGEKRLSANGFSISWNLYMKEEVLISVHGIKNGVSYKKIQSKNLPSICCKRIFESFIQWVQKDSKFQDLSFLQNNNLVYRNIKEFKNEYYKIKQDLIGNNIDSPFYDWRRKDWEIYYSFSWKTNDT